MHREEEGRWREGRVGWGRKGRGTEREGNGGEGKKGGKEGRRREGRGGQGTGRNGNWGEVCVMVFGGMDAPGCTRKITAVKTSKTDRSNFVLGIQNFNICEKEFFNKI
jgi:hypothetical protein